jgi:hypothetical protein
MLFVFWEDDSQDNFNANENLGGPNDISLSQARLNFEKYLSMYPDFNIRETKERLELKAQVISLFNSVLNEAETAKGFYWNQAQENYFNLYKLYRDRSTLERPPKFFKYHYK